MLFFLFLFFAFFETVSTACPNGSIASFSDPTKCFYFESQKLNWIAAEEGCKNLGGHLASIHNMLDNVFLSGEASTFFTDNASAEFWIGANKLFVPGNWSWSDETPWDFDDFGKKDNISNCGAVQLQTGKWIPANCLDVRPFSCLINEAASVPTSTAKPTTCQPSWIYYNGFCYKAFDNETWLNAQDRCKIDNANLTSIHTLEENLFIANLAYYNGVDGCDWTQQAWIGLFTEDENAHWNWTDGTPFDYENWMVGKPNPPQLNKSCGFILLASCGTFKIGDFDNAPCTTVLSRFVCKKLPN